MHSTIAVMGLACKGEIGFEQTEQLCRRSVEALRLRDLPVLDTALVMYNSNTAKAAQDILCREEIGTLLLCVGTWSEDNHLLELLPLLRRKGIRLMLQAFPAVDTGSLCGVHQITSVFTDIGFSDYSFVYGEPGDTCAIDAIEVFSKAAPPKTVDMLPAINIGAIGGRVPGMTEIAFDEFALYEKCGAVIIPISETELLDEVAAVTEAQIDEALPGLLNRGFRICSTAEALRESLAFYLGMKKLVQRYRLRGLAVKCYTRYMGKVCLGYSLLSDEDIVCSCEGDVTNAVMMRIMKDLSCQCINHTDLLYPDESSNTILFAHCGSCGFSMAPDPRQVELAPVRLQNKGVCSLFVPQIGKVTLADLVGHGDRLRMSVMVGEAVPTAMDFPGNPTRVRFDIPVGELCSRIAKAGCGHHWMIAYGDISEQLAHYCHKQGVMYQRIDA